MPDITTGFSLGSTVLGGLMQGDAASDAGGIQLNAAMMGMQAGQQGRREAQAVLQKQLDEFRTLMNPYINAGTTALGQKLNLLGLGGGAGATAAFTPQTRDQLRAEMLGQFTTQGAPTQTTTRVEQARLGEDDWIQPRFKDVVTNVAGVNTVDEAGLNASVENAFTTQGEARAGTPGMSAEDAQAAEIAKFENSPYFRAIARQSEDAILQNASATGGLRGGNTQDALSKNRPILLQGLIDKQLANLTGLTGSGQGAGTSYGNAGVMGAGQMATMLQQGGANDATAYNMAGAAQAGGALGQSNANIGMLGNIAGMFGQKFAGGGGIPSTAWTGGGLKL
jgi:hypothetical protein